MAIYDSIARMPQEKKAVIIGLCASAATYGALACDVVEMRRNSTFMVHRVQGGLYGTLEEIERDLEYMAELEERMIAIYASKAIISLDEVRALVYKTTYLTAQQALDYGFVDYVDGLTR